MITFGSERWKIKLVACVMILLITMMPLTETAFADSAEGGSSEGGSWYDEIPQMLKAGKYREGVVFAGIDLRKVDKTEDVSEDAEEIMTVDASAAGAETAGAAGLQSDDAAQEDCISITCIQKDGMTTEQILKELAEDGSVVFAEPDYIVENQEEDFDEKMIEEIRTLTAGRKHTARVSGNSSDKISLQDDTSISDMTPLQWGNSDSASLHAEGFSGGVSINVPNFGKEGSDMEGDPVVVAVIDYPIDFSVSDLKDVAYTFTEEEQKALGCDVHGYNATWQSEDGKLAPWPGSNHGTHCAGILGASWDGHGISGVASNVRIISIQNSIDDGKTSLINVLRGMAFVKKANELGTNIRITSNSWGLLQSSRALDAAVRELGEKQGVISIFASGNDGIDLSGANYLGATLQDNPYAIIVTSTDPVGELSDFGNYGDKTVTLGAPGSGIISTVPMSASKYITEASRDTNKLYEGFETSEKSWVKIDQADINDLEVVETDHEITGREGMGYAGEHALKIGLDSAHAMDYGSYCYYYLRMDLGDLSQKGVKAGDYLGFAFSQNASSMFLDCQYFDEESDEWISLENDSESGDSSCFGHMSVTIPEEADLSNFVLYFDYLAGPSAKAIYLDSIGVGTQTSPYTMMSGTSMACPAVSGGAAVIASRYPEAKGEELVKLVKSSVRSMPSLAGKTKTGSILDLSVNVGPEDGTHNGLTGKSDWVYGTELSFDKGTGDPFVFDAGGDREVSGPFQAIGGKLYYLPAVTKVEEEPAHKVLMMYDTKAGTWASCADMPVWLEKTSAAVHDGKLIVKGVVMEENDDIPYSAEDVKTAVYAYDPAGDSWTACSAEDVLMGDTLTANGDELLLVGSAFLDEDLKVVGIVRKYDTKSGVITELTELMEPYSNPQVTVSDGELYIYDRERYVVESIGLKDGEDCEDHMYTLPEYDGQPEPFVTGNGTQQSKRDAVLVPVPGGVLLIGPAAADGSSDTFLLKKGEDAFKACPRRTSDDSLQTLAAAVSGDRVYVIGAALREPGGRFFRSETIKNILKKLANPMKAKGKTVKLKAKKLKKKAVKISAKKAYKVTGAKGKVTYKKVKLNKKKYAKKFKVNSSSGKITVKKGVKKGTYKLTVKIKAAGDIHYSSKAKNVKVTIKVK